MEHQFYQASSALSWLFQWIAWPFYSGRIAAYRLMASLSIYAEGQLVRAETERFKAFISAAQDAESELADAMVSLSSTLAKRAASDAFEHTLQRMSAKFHQPDHG
jgi:hypothetical protein